MFQKLVMKENMRRIVTLGVYAAFLVFMVYSIITAQQAEAVFIYSLFLVFLLFAVMDEYFRFHYRRAVQRLCDEADAPAALEELKKVEARDFVRAYRPRIRFMRMLAAVDEARPEQALELAAAVPPHHARKLANRLSYAYASYMAYCQMGNDKAVQELYGRLRETPPEKFQKKVPFAVQGMMQANYLLAKGETKEALQAWEKFSPGGLNKREKAHYYLTGARIARRYKNYTLELECCQKARATAPAMAAATAYTPKKQPQ